MLRFVVGTYTRLLYGVDVDLKKNTSKPIWLFEAHEKGLTALAVDGIHLASTSGDETIKIYDHTKNIQIADVSVPTDVSNACVRYMRFTKKHLLACHDNGQITMWSRDSWLLVHVLKSSSSKGITGIAVHPSEKLALTVGGDGKLRLWDLVRGKGSKVVGLERAGELVDFLNDETFIVMSRTSVEAFNFNIESLYTYKSKSQLNTMCFYKDKIAVGQGDGKISILDASNGELLKQLDTKQKRVKALYAACGYLVSASSDGIVKIWNDKWECVAEHKVPEGNRVTCMVAMEALTSAVPKPQKRVSQSESESDSESSSSESEDESAEEKTETKVKAKRANKKKRVD